MTDVEHTLKEQAKKRRLTYIQNIANNKQ